ncbi:MAG: inositol monophosphatase [Patescibacteria group bacterium]
MDIAKAAGNIARLAGEELQAKLKVNGQKHIQEKDFGEAVTNFDREINQFIIEEIQVHFPDHDIVTEEAELVDAGSKSDRWFIDPIDGTNNFIRSIPMYCVSVGYEHDGVLSAGAIYDPLNDMLFAGSLDEAKIDGQTMKVSMTPTVSESMIFEGFGYDPQHKEKHINIAAEINRKTKYKRNLGSAALMLAYIAWGKGDGLVITGIKAWDCVAGIVLIRAAGGKVTNYEGDDWKPGDEMIIASNGKIHDELLRIVKS